MRRGGLLAAVLIAALAATEARAQVQGSGVGQSGTVTTNNGACWASPGVIKDCGVVPGAGNVVGPASAVSGNVPSYNGTTGKIIQDSGKPAAALPTAVGQLPGTATNDNASAGNLGEYLEVVVAQASPVAITSSGASQSIASLAITAGDWTCGGSIGTAPNGATTTTGMAGAIGTVVDTLPTQPNGGGYFIYNSAVGAGVPILQTFSPMRVSTAAGTTLRLTVNAGFAINAMGAFGTLNCRRAR